LKVLFDVSAAAADERDLACHAARPRPAAPMSMAISHAIPIIF
jgi:hypothetical protein